MVSSIEDKLTEFWNTYDSVLSDIQSETGINCLPSVVFPINNGEVVVRFSPSEEKKVSAQFKDEKILAKYADNLIHVPGLNGGGGRTSEIIFEGAKPHEFGGGNLIAYMASDMDTKIALGYIIDALTQKDHATAPAYLTEEMKEFFEWCQRDTEDISRYTGIAHTMHFSPGKGIRAKYELKGGITAFVRPGERYARVHIEFPTGAMAKRFEDLLIECGKVPKVRAWGHAGPEEGLRMLTEDIEEHASSQEKYVAAYHADNHDNLRYALDQLFKGINSSF
jgi:hypothetical protein